MRRIIGSVFSLSLAALVGVANPVQADGLAGNYLAARAASMHSDYANAAQYYALASIVDSSNPAILENAAVAYMAMGQFDVAAPLSRGLAQIMPNNQVASMARMTDALAKGVTPEISAELAAGNQIGPLVDQLLHGWAELELGNIGPAFEAFDTLIAEEDYKNFGLYHKGLALAVVGDYEGAEAILSGREFGQVSQTQRGVRAVAQILSQLGRWEVAVGLLGESFDPSNPVIGDLIDRLSSGEPVPVSTVPDARAGMSEAFYSIAIALNGQAEDSFTLLYARMAHYVDPRNTDAALLAANLLEQMRQYELASDTYALVPAEDPAYLAAKLGQAEALGDGGDRAGAIDALTELSERYDAVPAVFSTLGEVLHRDEQYAKAAKAYTRALELRPTQTPDQWYVYYVRGIAHERTGDWPAAEADFRTSLTLNPGQPNVMNYLGYSLVEKRQKLDEALELIRGAVEARPESGYITDSLGWVLYRLGRFDEAVAPMERAAALEPVDPVVNDHLGDVYWAVGRTREAQFQWSRALSFVDVGESAGEADPDRIRRKLDVGLDVVLEEEGAPSLAEKAAAAQSDG